MNKQHLEFEATVNKDGDYVCADTPVAVTEEISEMKSEADVAEEEIVVREKIADAPLYGGNLFMESYLQNMHGDQNQLLKKSQEGLLDLQREILKKMRGG